ncbi:hypothetical protein [Nonomuraea sp. NPDC050202]|jgi:hypothetical protein|uniref:hypothetical protein n=1 Tax=Nonomuraea sp. NPDC050202 TaxID=3155035 RepID=UPI0033DD4033
MSKVGHIAAVLAISTGTIAAISSGSSAWADAQPIIDLVDDIVPNANVLPNLLSGLNVSPNLSVSPSIICLPQARNNNSIKGDNNQTTTNQANNCTQSAQASTPPPTNGITGYEVVVEMTQCAVDDRTCEATARCPEGKSVTGGGFRLIPGGTDGPTTTANHSFNDNTGSGWFVEVTNLPAGILVFVQAYAVCANATP